MKVVYKQKQKPEKPSFAIALMSVIVVAAIMSFILPDQRKQPEKEYTIKATLPKIIKADKWISIAKQALSKSDLPSRDVSMILDSLSEFQNLIVLQVNSQLEADKKLEKPNPAKADSASKKTN